MPTDAVRLLRASAGDAEQTDSDLLGRFIDRRDGAAFALLVRRHGAMVYGVCRRVLGNDRDAEDAFQTTFLVLVEKARTVVPREAVGNWLYGVARRAALLSRRSITRRRERVGELPDCPAPEPLDDLRAVLDEELSRLPDVYRTAIVLCDLEGRTRREAAAVLGWPEGTVAGRLARAREMLAKRLAKHAPAVSVAAVLAGTASARVPDVLPLTAVIPSGVAALTREVLGVMARGTLMKSAVAVLLLGCAGFGMVLAGQKSGGPPKDSPTLPGSTEGPMDPPKLGDAAWGREVGGLQIGLAGVAPAYRHGEKAKLEVKLRNVGKAAVTITYGIPRETAPTIVDSEGSKVWVSMPPTPAPIVSPTDLVILPGKTITLYNPEVAVDARPIGRAGPEPLVTTPTIRVGPGRFRIAFGAMVHSHPALTTGDVAFEVMEPDGGVTAWGEVRGGLQAGLSLGGKRVYHHGETVTLAIRLRNAGKEPVKLHYIEPLVEHEPVVTLDGRPIPQPVKPDGVGERQIGEVELAPGKEIVLHELRRELRSAKWLGNDGVPSLHGAGKFGVRYEQVLGDPAVGHPGWKLDPVLSKLATGTLEFEVKEKPAPVTPEKDLRDLQGEWVVVAMEGGGRKASDDELKGMRWAVEGNEIRASQPGAAGKMSFDLDPRKSPKEIDVTSLDGNLKGTTSPGIYQLEGGKLRVCFGEKLRPRDFATAPGASRTMLTLEKVAVTVWGKEVGGLQAGLEVKEKRPYRLGETVTLLVRLRNVSKQAVKFEYVRQYLDENPPAVTGAAGKAIPQDRTGVMGVLHAPVEISLEPGKEVVLETRVHGASGVPYELCPAGSGGTPATKAHPRAIALNCLRFPDVHSFTSWPEHRSTAPCF